MGKYLFITVIDCNTLQEWIKYQTVLRCEAFFWARLLDLTTRNPDIIFDVARTVLKEKDAAEILEKYITNN